MGGFAPQERSDEAERGEVAPERLTGTVERVVFHNPENGFCVLSASITGRQGFATLVGRVATVNAGEVFEAAGCWALDPRHGKQFQTTRLKIRPPSTIAGIQRYLASGQVEGIGPIYAKRLVKAFGEEVLDVIDKTPARLREVPGIGPKRASRIVAKWGEQQAIREILVFLHSHGLGTARALRIFKTYGSQAVDLIRQNPYRLSRDIRGIGFKAADAVARELGIKASAMDRLRAGLSHVLEEARQQGHCGLARESLLARAHDLLQVAAEEIEQALDIELAEGLLVAEELEGCPSVFLPALYQAESTIAARLKGLVSRRPPWPSIDADKAITWVEDKFGVTLAASQRQAIGLALGSKVLVITGGPGVGKTTLVMSLLKILKAKKVRIALTAPTGRAAKRLAETTGEEAKTIHRLLEINPATGRFRRAEEEPLDCDLVVVDEASMVDVGLMESLLRAVPDRSALILVGDIDQLPSVGPGRVLADIIASQRLPVVRLTEVFRQAAESLIIGNAHRINQGQMPLWSKDQPEADFHFVACSDPADGMAKLVEIVSQRIPRRFGLDALRDVQVLTPMNRGPLGTVAINEQLQAVLNPPSEANAALEGRSQQFRRGDKVMQVENDYDKEVYNGDLGFVLKIDGEERAMEVAFDDRQVAYAPTELDQLMLAYATTIHKSQGSEFPAVVIPLITQHFTMLRRDLLYTAVTRGKRLVVIIGQEKALAMAVKQSDAQDRWTRLAVLLRD